VRQLQQYRLVTESLATPGVRSVLPTPGGTFCVQAFTSHIDGQEHLVLTLGTWQPHEEVLVRIHSECLTGDVLGSLRCDCGEQLRDSLRRISAAGRGAIVYLRGHEGRGIGLAAKISAYSLQDSGADTVTANLALGYPSDSRRFDAAAHILKLLQTRRVALLTNNPAKLDCLKAHGLTARREPLDPTVTPHNARYLRVKRDRLGHLLDLSDDVHGPSTTQFADGSASAERQRQTTA
jgi:3,4-dihydroxy 2-butanone 4-phosphate synthase / GTP cyclohydrolase II